MNEIQLTTAQVSLITIFAIWELIWKGLALWKASRKNDKIWYILMLVINSIGILPIIYIFFVSKGKATSKE